MKFRDLTINQIVEICKSRSACEGCPLAVEFIASHTHYTKCMADNLFFLSEPRKCGEYILNREVMDVDTGEITRCADCAHAEIYGCHVICHKAYGLELGLNSFCSEGVTRNEVG